MLETLTGWNSWAAAELDAIRAAGRWRATRSFDSLGPAGLLEGRHVVSFASNDYLGLSSHPGVISAAHEALDRWGAGSTASRLIVGSRPCHDELEAEIARWKGTDGAVLFPTGFAANLGLLGVVGGRDVTVFSDELNHASIIDGCRLSRSSVTTYRHADLDHLAELLHAAAGRKVVVTDSVFSMDGDIVDIDHLAQLCADTGALLIVDEAHSVLGPHVPTHIDGLDVLRVGTLSKSLGSLGGWVAGSSAFMNLLVNRARSYIFTTALSPADTAAGLAALRILNSHEGEALMTRLRNSIERLEPGHPSPIIPILLGDEQRAVDAAAQLLGRGIFIPAIRPPTVPVGTCRLRIALSAAHTDAMLADLEANLSELGLR
ncbi:MAG TPA: 8-amino-7-oxononanoate synthase [Ilumatobacter sp.]|nr:8-amino-7-oxononanoate synthase [Ilumatobacter sp.]